MGASPSSLDSFVSQSRSRVSGSPINFVPPTRSGSDYLDYARSKEFDVQGTSDAAKDTPQTPSTSASSPAASSAAPASTQATRASVIAAKRSPTQVESATPQADKRKEIFAKRQEAIKKANTAKQELAAKKR